ncbi:MAG: hotdog fold thioesterase [Rhodothermales bacterium]
MPNPAPIWHKPVDLDAVNALGHGAMPGYHDIVCTEVGDDYLVATMPVDHRTHTPHGVLHGGASVVLAETVGSLAGTLCVDWERQVCVGLEINANHIRSVRDGIVAGTARPLHLGKRTQVWNIEIRDEAGRLVCVSRLTLAVIDRG